MANADNELGYLQIDVRLRFRKPPAEYNDRTCIIVVDIKGVSVGLIVDTVQEVMSIDDSDIVPPLDGKIVFHNRYIKGIGKKDNAQRYVRYQ